jgi:preprotein translocase subunit Sec63
MDAALSARLNNLTAQNGKLRDARNAYLLKEAERKHFEARIVKNSVGKSHAEKMINAQATVEWLNFQKELAVFEGAYEFEKLKYEILNMAWTSEYGTYKIEEGLIKKQSRGA